MFEHIEALLEPIPGAGELYVYDTSFRIGVYLGLYPTKVYLHRGTRVGAIALGYDGKQKALDKSVLRGDFVMLEAFEIEDILCIFKDEITPAKMKTEDHVLLKRSWCG